jgi:hypothetical protein
MISNEVLTSPGLLPVVQVIEVVVEEDTTHWTPSIITEFSYEFGENRVPVNVTSVPPRTVPNLGSIFERVGVDSPWYDTLLERRVFSPF